MGGVPFISAGSDALDILTRKVCVPGISSGVDPVEILTPHVCC